jgi:large subunit ribosomal protein L23
MKGFDDPWKVLMYPQLAEKSMNMVEVENKLVFIVNPKAAKKDIKQAIEKNFEVRVLKISTMITTRGQKKAFIKLHPEDSAADIASRMGML